MKASNISTGRPGPVVGAGSPRVPAMINPLRSEAAERFVRTLDSLPLGGAPGGGGSFDGNLPFKLVQVDSANVKVLLGTLNGFVPTGIAAPIDVSGTDAKWSVYIHATLDGSGNVTAVEVVSDKTGTVPSDDATNSYRLDGYVTVVSGAITTVEPSLYWSMYFKACAVGVPPYTWGTGA